MIVEFASAFDLSRKCEMATRISYIKELNLIYGNKNLHELKEDFKGFHVSIKYLSKIKCSETKLISEFNSIWPVIGKTWLKFKDTKPSSSESKCFWTHILRETLNFLPKSSRPNLDGTCNFSRDRPTGKKFFQTS